MARHKDSNWNLPLEAGTWGGLSIEHATVAVLMDIRDELKALNGNLENVRVNTLAVRNTLQCSNFQRIPRVLDRISANTHKPRKKRKKKV